MSVIAVAAAFGLNPGGLSVEAGAPDMMLLVLTWGLGYTLPTEAALSEMRFLCSRFHYIRVQQGGGGVRRQLGYGTRTQWWPAQCKPARPQMERKM